MARRRKLDSATLPRRFPAYLAEPVRKQLLALAESVELMGQWEPGRQGTGYDKLDLFAAIQSGALESNRAFLNTQIVTAKVAIAVDSPRGWDAYLLRYQHGAFVPEHRDPTTDDCHLRLNALVLSADNGTGQLRLDGDVFELNDGDAMLFRPDVIPHRISVVEGERFVFSVGCAYDQPA